MNETSDTLELTTLRVRFVGDNLPKVSGNRAGVGGRVLWGDFQDRIEGELLFLLGGLWHLRGAPASDFHGTEVRVEGVTVATLDTVGLDCIDDLPANVVLWESYRACDTVGEVVRGLWPS